MLKRLIKYSNSRAIVLDKTILEAAGISENALFQISINPSGGLSIQSIEDTKTDVFIENFEKLSQLPTAQGSRLVTDCFQSSHTAN